MISLHLLAGEHPLDDCLQSFGPHVQQIIVGDMGLTKENLQVCRAWNAQVIQVPKSDRSLSRNTMLDHVTEPWVLHVEPWESLVRGAIVPTGHRPFAFQIVQKQIVTRQIRLWRNAPNVRFRNPIFETTGLDGGTIAGVILAQPPLKVIWRWSISGAENHPPLPILFIAVLVFFCL